MLDTNDPMAEGAAVRMFSVVSSGSEGVSAVDNEGEVFPLSPTRVDVAHDSFSSGKYRDAITGVVEVLALHGATVNR